MQRVASTYRYKLSNGSTLMMGWDEGRGGGGLSGWGIPRIVTLVIRLTSREVGSMGADSREDRGAVLRAQVGYPPTGPRKGNVE